MLSFQQNKLEVLFYFQRHSQDRLECSNQICKKLKIIVGFLMEIQNYINEVTD